MADVTVRQSDLTRRFVNDNPEKAHVYADQWHSFITEHPEAATIKSAKEWYSYIKNKDKFPDGGPSGNLWICKEITDTLSSPTSSPERQMAPSSEEEPWLAGLDDNARLAALPALAFFGRPQAMDEDKRYHKIRKNLRKEWLKSNPRKDFNSAEGLDFLYGSLEGPSSETLETKTEELFRERYAPKAKKYDKKQLKKEKLFKDAKKDPVVLKQEFKIHAHAQARYQLAKKNGTKEKLEDFQKTIEKRTWDEFVKKHHTTDAGKEKLDKYAVKHTGIRDALANLREINEKKELESLKPVYGPYLSPTTPKDTKPTTRVSPHSTPLRDEAKKKPAISPHKPLPAENLYPLSQNRSTFLPPSQPHRLSSSSKPVPQPIRQRLSPLGRGRPLSSPANKVKKAKKEANNIKNLKKLAELAKYAKALNPVSLIVIVIVIIIFIVVLVLIGGTPDNAKADPCDPTQETCSPDNVIEGLTLTLSGPQQVKNQETIQYRIDVSYTGTEAITVYDSIPENTTFVTTGTSDVSITEKADDVVTMVSWELKQNTTSCTGQGATTTCTFSITLLPSTNDVVILNRVFATSPQSKITGLKSALLANAIETAAEAAKIPAAFLVAISQRESGLINYTDEDITTFSTQGWWSKFTDDAPSLDQLPPLIRKGYAYNTCAFPKNKPICPGKDVRGAMQFEEGTWNEIKNTLHPTDGHDPDRRNVVDVINGAAMLNKQHALNPLIGNSAASNWDEKTVKGLARWYCAGQGAVNRPELVKTIACGWRQEGDKTYDDAVWEYYKDFN